MPHLDTTTYLHSIFTFWLFLTMLMLWSTKLHYLMNKQTKSTQKNEHKTEL